MSHTRIVQLVVPNELEIFLRNRRFHQSIVAANKHSRSDAKRHTCSSVTLKQMESLGGKVLRSLNTFICWESVNQITVLVLLGKRSRCRRTGKLGRGNKEGLIQRVSDFSCDESQTPATLDFVRCS